MEDLAMEHLLKIPCTSMPFVCEADYSVTLTPMIHMDRTAPFHVAIYLFKERGKGVKLNERLLFNHFFNSGAGSASSVYPLVEAQAQRNR